MSGEVIVGSGAQVWSTTGSQSQTVTAGSTLSTPRLEMQAWGDHRAAVSSASRSALKMNQLRFLHSLLSVSSAEK